MATGRSTEPRPVTITTTASSAALAAPAGTFEAGDVGRTVTGPGIPTGATITSVASTTAATLSAPATASATVTAQLGSAIPSAAGFLGWSPETAAEAATYRAPGTGTPPDRLTDAVTPATSTRRSRG